MFGYVATLGYPRCAVSLVAVWLMLFQPLRTACFLSLLGLEDAPKMKLEFQNILCQDFVFIALMLQTLVARKTVKIANFLDIIHHPNLIKNDVSEDGICLHPQAKPILLGPIYRTSPSFQTTAVV
jgi:hypothetical protein